MGIEWNSTKENPPLPGKEIVAKDPLKPVNKYSSRKQGKTMKFSLDFTTKQILDVMLGHGNNLSLWSYMA